MISLTSCTSFQKMMMISSDNPMISTPDSISMGSKLFSKNCISCHGEIGKGDGPAAQSLQEPPANLQMLAKKKSANTFAANIYYGKNEMPAFKDILTEDEIWHLANYVKSLAKQDMGL